MAKLRDNEQYQSSLRWYDDEDMDKAVERSFWTGLSIGTLVTVLIAFIGLAIKFS